MIRFGGPKGSSRGGRKGGRGKYPPKRRVCPFCAERGGPVLDYKDPVKLGRFITDRGKIGPRRMTGACAKHQRALAEAIKRARHLALLPYAPGHIYATGGVGVGRRAPRPRRFEGPAGRPAESAPKAVVESGVESAVEAGIEPAVESVADSESSVESTSDAEAGPVAGPVPDA